MREEEVMGARRKLNSMYLYIAALVAAFIGLSAQSWLIFGISLGVLVLLSLHSGSIRVRPRRK